MYKRLCGFAWLFFALSFLILVQQPVSVDAQWNIAATALAVATAIYIIRLEGVWRYVFLSAISIVVFRYAYWRTTSTIPSPDDLISFIPAILLYGAEMYCLLMLALSLFVVADPIERPRAAQFPDEELPSVDVFVPSYNESSDILSLTLAAAKGLDYPAEKLRIFLLDDGGTDQKRLSSDKAAASAAIDRHHELQHLCTELGVTYLTRSANVHAKAGNLNNGLLHSRGDLVVVFDADHAPAREFLRETVGHFIEDRKLFLVQTPHFFANPDPLERNLSTFQHMPSENEMFYGQIQKGLDKWNSAFFCGSAAVLRRSALEQVGGFSGVSITEDCETALDLHSRGWNSLYVDRPMVVGLQPDTVASFIGQRSRWCRGMLQIMLLKNPLFRSGLSLPQRLCYMSSMMFWFFPFVRLAFLVAPLLLILFDLKIFDASVDEFIAYSVSYLIAGELLRNYLYGRVRWPWVSDLYEYVQSVYLLRAIVSVILNPRRPTFNVTAKGQTLDRNQLSELAWPYFAIFGVLLFATGVVAYRFQTEPEIGGMLLVVGAWNLLNLIVAGAALGVVTERMERRQTPRLASQREGQLFFGDERIDVSVEDVSLGGAKVTVLSDMANLPDDRRARLLVNSHSGRGTLQSIPIEIRSFTSSDQGLVLGVNFRAGTQHYATLANLMVADLDIVRKHRAGRQVARGVFRGSLGFIRWGLARPFQAFHHLLFDRDEPSAMPSKPVAPAVYPSGAAVSSEQTRY
ncbi:UDP-forming cellulose synthase catalytic subunit [Fulvimarina sp. 2208YS6-2-32]|uniref:Cellulose synthase catalytic subunit [UDP-forming] n=1 Tax=Fulvimarina uroteuthidis TaxID=3098149 RepID=A0ABU5I6Q2_9HYPH|nr:UDP-forming cellulose synthase catalytic subunit [Fulvimarina sp. 2208YS6-2-32]MDY8110800.1 UDP-forming cellulose synthase catalytic subunit [Fulvimarina sp. 2208YS6-2-32]